MGCYNYILPLVSEPKKPKFSEIIKMMNILEVGLSSKEIKDMKDAEFSYNLWADFIPKKHADSWYNVRIGTEFYTILEHSNHKGFR